MSKRNEEYQRIAKAYWDKLKSTGMAYEISTETLVITAFREGMKAGAKLGPLTGLEPVAGCLQNSSSTS